ncbi:hypothetical protein [Novosphingobium marinum]|uniref:Uncharacterized protein n=1 Tax=Novosphingobium marinum TaxID=1514948 RepID=A0A7Y9XYY6_9SPHN|nr:hypothetical protein [Novosphingobium marinum]NYH97030.1 hypothetical protein [Novosphingobium marinum]
MSGKVTRLTCLIVVVVWIFGFAADLFLVSGPGETSRRVATRFSLASDSSIPTYLASMLLLSCSILLLLSATTDAASRYKRSWQFLAFVFIVLSLDEVAMLHELSGKVLERVVPAAGNLGGVFNYSWTLVGIPAVGLLALILARWYFALPGKSRYRFGLAAVLFLGGSIGIEMYNSLLDEKIDGRHFEYSIWTAIEEALEFSGLVMFQYGLLRYVTDHRDEVNVAFR